MNTKFLSQLSHFLILVTSVAFTVPASAYTLQDDPSSTWSGDSSTIRTINGNVVTYQNLFAQNLTTNSLPALSFVVPFIWPNIDSTYLPIEWRNDLNGWYTSDFNNTGTSLTVTLTNPIASSVLMGELADLTGSGQLPFTEPCQSGSPSCTPAPYPAETRHSTDLVPIFSLGAFEPEEVKRFDLSFTYSFGDGKVEALPTAFIGNTVSPIPEPETYAMLLAGLSLLGWRMRKAKS